MLNEPSRQDFIRLLARGPGSGSPRLRQWLPWQQTVAIRRVISERGDDHRVLHQIFSLEPIVDVHVGVMRNRVVLDLILHELETWQANVVE